VPAPVLDRGSADLSQPGDAEWRGSGGGIGKWEVGKIVEVLAAQRVHVAPAQVYNVKSTMAKPKANGYADLSQAKKLATRWAE
jgi:hypothetical protein